MDQSRYWIQKDQPCLNPHVLSSFGDSWEEQAFAEDATGALGGCVWPPRSYTCSFCRREFRSAQALGGHMNVHRRDRARLKKISSSNDNNQVLDLPPTSFDICLLQNPNPNLDLDHVHPLYSSSSSKPPTLSIIRPFSYSFGQDHQKGTPILSCSKFELPQKRFHHIPYLGYDNQDKGSTAKVVQSNSRVRRRCDDNKDDDEDECLIVKKRRIDDHQGGVRPFFPKNSNLVNGVEAESVVLPLEGSTNSSLETLDLELRLGDRRS